MTAPGLEVSTVTPARRRLCDHVGSSVSLPFCLFVCRISVLQKYNQPISLKLGFTVGSV